MTIKKILLVGLAIFTLSACNDDDNNHIDKAKGAEGYLSLTLATPQTKTVGDTVLDGTVEESKIENVTVALTDENGAIAHVVAPTLSGNSTKFAVELGSYKVYTLVNNPVTIQVGQNIERVITIGQAADAEDGFKDGSFFMVNERNSSTGEAGVFVTISAFNTEGNPALATVNVDRVAVKIQDEKEYTELNAPTGVLPTVTKLKVEGFALLNMNKEFNLIQTWGDANTNGTQLAAGSEVLQTPLYTVGSLVKDQYFKNISEYVTIGKDADGDVVSYTDLTKEETGIYKLGATYTSENRPTILFYGNDNKLTAGRGEATGVIYKVQAMDGSTPAGTFYSYNNKYYQTLAEVNALADFKNVTLPTAAPELRALGIKVYENGVIYYSYFILDPNKKHQYGEQNYYGVLRNSIYNLSINEIKKIGDDIPGGYGIDPNSPETENPPINADEAYINVTVTVNQWVINNIGIDL